METTQRKPDTIMQPATTPSTPRKLFVNIPVADLARAMDFFGTLGFEYNPQLCDETAACMLVGEDAYFMLLTKPRFDGFAKRPANDPQQTTAAMFAFSARSRAEVDELADKALAGGGAPAADPIDHGFMYGRSFFDLDGHHWEVFWMDPSAIEG